MKKALVILAHPDDEIFFSYHLYKKEETLDFVFLTDGVSAKLDHRVSPQQRTNEAINALKRNGIIRSAAQIHPIGQLEKLRDGFLDVDISSVVFEKLKDILFVGEYRCIYTTDFEGAHQDHDTCNLISKCLGDQFDIPVQVFGTYPGTNNPILRFNVMPVQNKIETRFKERLKVISFTLRMMFAYPSQKKTWSILGPLIILKLLFVIPSKSLSSSKIDVRLIPNALYSRMERRDVQEVYQNQLAFLVSYRENKT